MTVATSDDLRTVHVALAANAAIATAKAAAAVLTGSKALLAESAHSLADTVNQVFLRVSISRARRVPDLKHPFGYGKERFFWAFLAAAFIFVSGSVFSFIEGLRALTGADHQVTRYTVSYGVLAVSGVAEALSFARALRHVRADAASHERGVLAEIRRTRNTSLKVVVVEDAAGLVGVALAAAGTAMHQLTGDGRWDAVAAMSIGVLLGYVAYALARDTKALLLGEAAHPNDVAELERVLAAHPEVVSVVALLTMHIGPESLLVAARVDLRDDIRASEIERLSDTIDREMRQTVPAVSEVFLDATPGRQETDH